LVKADAWSDLCKTL